jgi:hypothetical protein
MATVTYAKYNKINDPMIGKYEHPIKMIIESESNSKYGKEVEATIKALYNREKSTRYSETAIGESDFDVFQSAVEGAGAENDSVQTTFTKTIFHHSFMKEFSITKEMMDDAKFGISAQIQSKPIKLVNSYHKTLLRLACAPLIHGTETSCVFAKAKLDCTTGDGLSLFNSAHTYFTPEMAGETQSNYFSATYTNANEFEDTLNTAANKLRNFKDENGETLDYVADTIILPCNRPHFEKLVKAVVGSERLPGGNFNDINIQYGNWTIVILPGWECDDDRFIIMSSDANRSLSAAMFYDRVPLDIRYWVDDHTRNMNWNGYARHGIGFNTWKHCALVVPTGTVAGSPTDIDE